jgi:hypothetical protein
VDVWSRIVKRPKSQTYNKATAVSLKAPKEGNLRRLDKIHGFIHAMLRCAVVLLLIVVAHSPSGLAQSPASPASGPLAKPAEGFTPGFNAGIKFEGSTSADGSVFDLSSGVGYNFSRHFGMDLGIPYYFVGTPAAVKKNNPQGVSGDGLGSLGLDLKGNFAGELVNYDPTLHFTAPTGETKKGLSTGHATWNLGNHFEHGWNNFTPFVDLGVGNTVNDTKYFHRPFMTFGYNLQSEAGTEVDAGPLSLTASAYDVAPWGTQTVFSRVFRCSSATTCTANGKSTNRKGYLDTSVQSGSAALARDNGFNFGVEAKPIRYVDLEAGYSRSVPLHLNSFSFGVSLDMRAMSHRGKTAS